MVWAEALVACATAVVVTETLNDLSLLVFAALALWAALTYLPAAVGGATRRPGLAEQARRAAFMVALLTASSAVPLINPTDIPGIDTAQIPGAALAVLVAAVTASFLGGLLTSRLAPPERVVVVGDASEVADVLRCWSRQPRVEVVGACVVEPSPRAGNRAPADLGDLYVVRSLDEVPDAVAALAADSVAVVPGPSLQSLDLRRLSWSLEASRTPLSVISVLEKFAPHRVRPNVMGGQLVVSVAHTHLSRVPRAVKTVVDRALGTLLLVLFAPVIGALCLWVRLDSPGGAFFRQQRIGLDGVPFTMYKLRTMTADAEERKIPLQRLSTTNEMLFKIKDDPRVTRVGRLLRRASLDELPQLINVAKGEMSLVGPRPPLPDEVARYDDESRRRLAVRPGITGLWQVSGRSDLDWEQSLALDLHYVDNWRFSDDVLIAFRTFEAVFRSRGAY